MKQPRRFPARRANAVFLAMAAASLMYSAEARAQITLSDDKPVAGQQVTITLTEPVSEIEVTYRPNSKVAKKVSLKAEPPATSFTWTPDRAGVVNLAAGKAKKDVSVQFSSFSWSGLFIMIFAGAILFGGVAFAFWLLFRRND